MPEADMNVDPYTLPTNAMAPLQSTAVTAQGYNSGYQAPTISTASSAATTVPPVPGASGGAGNPGFFGVGGGASMAIGAIGTLGSLWNSFQQNKLAKKSLALQERAFETNLGNQTKSYNTALEDRINARYATEGKSAAEAASYVQKNRL